MGTVQSSQYTDHEGMFHSLPGNFELPWIPPWSAIAFQENRNNATQGPNSQLSVKSKNFPEVYGNSSNEPMQSTSKKSLVSDQSMIFQNMVNENWLKNPQKIDSSNNPRKNIPKTSKRNRSRKVRHQVKNDDITNPSYERRQGHKEWNHVPVINWSQPNLHSRPINTNFPNPLRFGYFNNKRHENRHRFQNSTWSQFYSSGSTNASEEAASCVNFKSRNRSNSGRNVGNAVSRSSSVVNNRNRSRNMERIIPQVNSNDNSKNSVNFNKSNEEDDITYLFTVDSSSEQQMVLEIDLHSQGMNLVPNKCSRKSTTLIQDSRTVGVTANQSITIEKPASVMPSISRKRKISEREDKTNKRASYQPRCTACIKRYDDVIEKDGNMYISTSCNHIFCRLCICKGGNLKVCPACGTKFLSFRRLFL